MNNARALETIRSKDGVTIAYDRSGSGPPLVIVHGSLSDRTAWQFIRPSLEEHFTVYGVNRRGREGSDVMARHNFEDEFEDVAAVVDAVGGPIHLIGHSFGAHCALGATLLTDNIKSLILYEPPPPGLEADDGMHVELRELMEAGKPDEVVATFMTRGPEMPNEQIAGLRQSPIWPTFVSFAQPLVEEIDALVRYQFDPARFAQLTMPVLLLVGDQSPPKMSEVNRALDGALPHAQLAELVGQAHTAHVTAPELLVAEIMRFLDSVES